MNSYWRITINDEGRTIRFWAADRKKMQTKLGAMTLYTPCDREGQYGRMKGNDVVVQQQLIADGLIVSEKPAVMDKHYGWLRVEPLMRGANEDRTT